MYRRRLREGFALHLFLGLVVGLVLTWVDVQFCPLGWQLPGEIGGWPIYHVGLILIGATMYGILAVTYYFHTKDALGTAILLAIGFIFGFFHVEDVLYYWMSGKPIPDTLPWLWETKYLGKVATREDVLLMSKIGAALILVSVLGFFYARRRRKRF